MKNSLAILFSLFAVLGFTTTRVNAEPMQVPECVITMDMLATNGCVQVAQGALVAIDYDLDFFQVGPGLEGVMTCKVIHPYDTYEVDVGSDTIPNSGRFYWTAPNTDNMYSLLFAQGEELFYYWNCSIIVGSGYHTPFDGTYAVMFNLGEHGTWTGGGALEQHIEEGSSAVAPEFVAESGWKFCGWDADFSSVVSNMTISALWTEKIKADPPTVSVDMLSFKQRYPWNGMVDIYVDLTCSDPTTNIYLYMSAKDVSSANELIVSSVWIAGDETQSHELIVKSGSHHFIWDAAADNPNLISENIRLCAEALVGSGRYISIRLFNGEEPDVYTVSDLYGEPIDGWTDDDKTTNMILRLVMPGIFRMGCEPSELGYYGGYEATPHDVELTKPFYMGIYPVTQKQYELVTGVTNSYNIGASRPVDRVSWNSIRGDDNIWPSNEVVSATSFMGLLRCRSGIESIDLPTEAEWEYACRAGTQTAFNSGKNMVDGSDSDANMAEVGRYSFNSNRQGPTDEKDDYSGSAIVGLYKPNRWGLYDMHGNVWEWCLDWFQSGSDFTEDAAVDPIGPGYGTTRVIRGGGWSSGARTCRSAHREGRAPIAESFNTGFRARMYPGYERSIVCASASSIGSLDLETGVRFRAVHSVEEISYSSAWDECDDGNLMTNGVVAVDFEGAGTFQLSLDSPGMITLTHATSNTQIDYGFVVLPENVRIVSSDIEAENAVWDSSNVYLITDNVKITPGSRLTIAPGTVVKFLPDCSLTVPADATCTAKGVVFAHAYDDSVGGDLFFDGDMTKPRHSDYSIVGVVDDDENTVYRDIDRYALKVTDLTFRQRYLWNGITDIDFTVKCSDPGKDIYVTLFARDETSGENLTVKTCWLENNGKSTNDIVIKSGRHRIVWDAKADNPKTASNNVRVTLKAQLEPEYLCVDLSGEAEADSYPMSARFAMPSEGWTDDFKSRYLVMRKIPAGTFTMGSPTTEVGRKIDEKLHEVSITKPFYVGVFEITQKQYINVMGTNPSSYEGELRPVENVSWNMLRGDSQTFAWPQSRTVDENTFIGKLRAKSILRNIDLPTEAMWEYACRAGTATALNSGKNLNGSSRDANMDEVGRYGFNCGNWPDAIVDGKGGYDQNHTVVGSYMPNRWGLYDMHGNVWEWVLDWYGPLSTNPDIDPVGAQTGSRKVLRGGGWDPYAWYCRSANRHYDGNPNRVSNDIGFRLASIIDYDNTTEATSPPGTICLQKNSDIAFYNVERAFSQRWIRIRSLTTG